MRKLRSERGTSAAIALLLFLVASMAAIVMLNAAVTGVKSVRSDGEWQRENLAVSSAARLIADCIKESDVTVTTVQTVVTGEEPSDETETFYDTSGHMGRVLLSVIRDLETFPDAPERGLTIELNGAECEFSFSVNPPSGSYEDATDPYKMTGVVTESGGTQKVYLTAWMKTVPTAVISTHTVPEEDKTVTTSVTVYKWDGVQLSTTGGAK